MIILRSSLYITCFTAITWIVTIFVGPVILKSLISSYSNDQISASNINVTPKLDVKIGRLDYALSDNGRPGSGQGFSRSVNISWSIFSKKPFLQLEFGPTVIKSVFAADSLTISTPVFSEINFHSIELEASVENTELQSDFLISNMYLKGVFQINKASITNISADMHSIGQQVEDRWFSDRVIAELGKLDLSVPIVDQSLPIEIAAAEVTNQFYGTRLSDLNGILTFFNNNIVFDFGAKDLAMVKSGWLSRKVNAEGVYGNKGLIKNAHLELLDISNKKVELNHSKIIIDFLHSGNDRYELKAEGEFKPFELNFSENYIGRLPNGNFEIRLSLNNETEISATSSVTMKYMGAPDIFGSGDLSMRIDSSNKISDCFALSCEIVEFLGYYTLRSADELLEGETRCNSTPCHISSASYKLKTSNTAKILAIITQSQILSPIYALYFYGFMSNGTPSGNGHEIKIND